MQLVLVPLGCRAPLEVTHIRALLGNDQRPLELAGILLVDPEIGRQFHRATHTLGNVDERSIGEHGAIQRRVIIIRHRNNRAEIFPHQFRMLFDGIRNRAENYAGLFQLFLERCHNGDRVEHRVHRDLGCLYTRKNFLFAQRNTELLVSIENCRIDLVQRLWRRIHLWRRIIIGIVEIDLRIGDARPIRLSHGQPTAIGIKPPLEHPFRLALFRRDKPDNIFRKALRRFVDFEFSRKPVFVLVHVKRTNLLDSLFNRNHSSLPTFRLQGPTSSSLHIIRSGQRTFTPRAARSIFRA